jgi:hypothetical protein
MPSSDASGKALRPICMCGEKMKKAYTTPVLFRLSNAEVDRYLGNFEEGKYASS